MGRVAARKHLNRQRHLVLSIDADTHLATRAADNKALDEAGIVLDSDPRKVTQVGNAVQNADQRYPATQPKGTSQ